MKIYCYGITCFLISLASTAFCAGTHWNQFRGPGGDGIAPDAQLPLEFSGTKNVQWRTPIHDLGWSSPVVWKNQAWVTTAREDGSELFAVCVNLETGKIIHDIKVFDVAKPQNEWSQPKHSCHTHANHRGRPHLCPLWLIWHRLSGHSNRKETLGASRPELRSPGSRRLLPYNGRRIGIPDL